MRCCIAARSGLGSRWPLPLGAANGTPQVEYPAIQAKAFAALNLPVVQVGSSADPRLLPDFDRLGARLSLHQPADHRNDARRYTRGPRRDARLDADQPD